MNFTKYHLKWDKGNHLDFKIHRSGFPNAKTYLCGVTDTHVGLIDCSTYSYHNKSMSPYLNGFNAFPVIYVFYSSYMVRHRKRETLLCVTTVRRMKYLKVWKHVSRVSVDSVLHVNMKTQMSIKQR